MCEGRSSKVRHQTIIELLSTQRAGLRTGAC